MGWRLRSGSESIWVRGGGVLTACSEVEVEVEFMLALEENHCGGVDYSCSLNHWAFAI